MSNINLARCRWLTLIAACTIFSGCFFDPNDGSSQRVAPTQGTDTARVEYNPISSDATYHQIEGQDLAQLVASPEEPPSMSELRAGSEHVFEGKLNSKGLGPGTFVVEFFQIHPKLGKVVTQTAGAMPTFGEAEFSYVLHVKTPELAGKHHLEIQFSEFNLETPGEVKVHVIAKGVVNVTKQ